MRVDIELLEFNLRQWFLDVYHVVGYTDGVVCTYEVFAGSHKDARIVSKSLTPGFNPVLVHRV